MNLKRMKQYRKIFENKNLFLKMIDIIKQLLSRLAVKKRKTQITNIRNERWVIATEPKKNEKHNKGLL